ncbi:GAF domain-containing protein [Longitalea luteola]|uniref:GAF domain-containing protein n=1 Tax=Longitalea luteola TaxID=2812563 RepID=UPI001A95DD85|nr:GAF domain-containing protein [Longitalea luteola]
MSQFSKYDSEFCGNIPIHIINTTQEYGVLLVLDRHKLTIEQLGENAEAFFGSPFKNLAGKPVQDLIGAAASHVLEEHLQKGNGKYATAWEIKGERYNTLLHVKENMVIVEMENQPAADTESSFSALYQSLRETISQIESATDIKQVCTIAAAELKRITGFDKVMIYAFDQDWNGNVLAEAMEPDMESYIGFTFPASDIPKPARDMYQKNPYRFIPDRDFKPVKLYPVINPITNTFLDMSECNLRGVAAVHVEYLKNMQVMASMSVRLLKDGALWGLIACHHKTARRIDNQLCTVLEFLSTVISARINLLYHQKVQDLSARLNSLYTQLIENIYQSKNLVKSLLHEKPHVLDLFDAQGVVITYRNKKETAGEVPNASQLEDLVLWLHLKNLRKVFYTDSLSGIYDMAAEYQDIASGMLVIPIQAAQDEYLILFRKEFIRTTSWGGNPEERIFFDKDPKIYHPRHSFKLWQEHVKGFSKPWLPEEIMAAENLRSFIYELINPEPLALQQ